MDYLRSVNEQWWLAALEIQDRLWSSYAATHGANIGISAMPSMHVTIAVLMALVAWRTRRWLGIAYPVVTLVVIMATANHFLLDAVGGAAALLLGFAAQRVISGEAAVDQAATQPRLTPPLTHPA